MYKDFEARNPILSGDKAYNFKMWKIDQRMEQSCKNILGKAYSKAPSYEEISEFLVFEQCLEKLEDFADDVLEITDDEWAFPDIAQSYMNFYNDGDDKNDYLEVHFEDGDIENEDGDIKSEDGDPESDEEQESDNESLLNEGEGEEDKIESTWSEDSFKYHRVQVSFKDVDDDLRNKLKERKRVCRERERERERDRERERERERQSERARITATSTQE